MLNSHESLGIAQIAFYLPAIPIVIWLMIRNGQLRPRMAWYPLIPFSIMRLAGGVVTIFLKHNPDSIGLFVAAIVLLNTGVIPLTISTLGLVRVVLMDNYRENPKANKISALIRLAIAAAICLLTIGGAVSSLDNSQDLSRALSLVGYVLFAAVLIALISMELFFWRKRETLLPSSQTVLRGALLASPFLIIRAIYGIVAVALENTAESPFDPITGSAVAFGLMALLPEYIAVAIYVYSGFSIAPDRGLAILMDEQSTNEQTATKPADGADNSNSV